MAKRKPLPSNPKHPRYWFHWIGWGLLWLLAQLPRRQLWQLGRLLGAIGYRLAVHRRHVASRNLRIAFPEDSDSEHQQRIRDAFTYAGLAATESLCAWHTPLDDLAKEVTITGMEHIQEPAERGQGVLMFGAHFSTIDIAGALLTHFLEFDAIYREHRNAAINHFMVNGRARSFAHVHARSELGAVIRRLRAGKIIWYAGDQDYGPSHSVFAPFFGTPAATITAGFRLARLGKAKAVFASHYRTEDPAHWHIRFTPIDLPKDDEQAAELFNQHLEGAIREHPAQYLWLHRRYKTRPDGVAGLY